MTKQEFIARMERDIDEDIEIECFAITGTCEKEKSLISGLCGRPMEIVAFVTRVLKMAAKAMKQEPRVMAGAIELMLTLGGEEKAIEVDVSAIDAMKEAADDDE